MARRVQNLRQNSFSTTLSFIAHPIHSRPRFIVRFTSCPARVGHGKPWKFCFFFLGSSRMLNLSSHGPRGTTSFERMHFATLLL